MLLAAGSPQVNTDCRVPLSRPLPPCRDQFKDSAEDIGRHLSRAGGEVVEWDLLQVCMQTCNRFGQRCCAAPRLPCWVSPTACLPSLPCCFPPAVKELPTTKAIDKLVKGGGKDGQGLRLQSEKPVVLLLGAGWGAHSIMKVGGTAGRGGFCLAGGTHSLLPL